MTTELSKRDFERIPRELLEGGFFIAHKLRSAGHEALFAGGVVRDLLLGLPVSDIDIATSASPADIEALFPKTIEVGRQFGVMIVVVEGVGFEVATFRSDDAYLDGRRPSAVHFTNAEEDAKRRDFTVNALFLDPETRRVIDYVGGAADLERQTIRTVGDPAARMDEDKLRVLRAIRFACRLAFEIEPKTYEEVRRRAPDLLRVSWERIRDELVKMLTGPHPARALDLLSESGALEVILPEVAAMRGVPQPPEFHPEGDVFIHTRLMFEIAGRIEDPTLALAVLLHDVGKPPTMTVRERIRFDGHDVKGAALAGAIARRLRLTNEQTEEIVELVRDHLRFIPIHEMRESTLKRFLRRPNIAKHLELHRLDCLASHQNLTSYDYCREKLSEFSQESMKPAPLLSGDDLIGLGFKPGPKFGLILTELEDLQLEGRILTREEALEFAKSRYAGDGPEDAQGLAKTRE